MSTNKNIQIILKEKINNMPDDIDVKEIIPYVKNALKEAMVEGKNKRTSKNKDINEDKPKYSLSAYQEYMKEQQNIFKEKYPELSSKDRLVKIAEEWNKSKKNNTTDNNIKNIENTDEDIKVKNDELVADTNDNVNVEEINVNVKENNVNIEENKVDKEEKNKKKLSKKK